MSCDFISVSDAKFLIKYIFAFHIIKNNFYFFYRPIAITSSPPFPQGTLSISTGIAMVRSHRPNRRASHPSLSPTVKPKPSATDSIHQFLHVAEPLMPISNPPDSIPDQEVSPPDSRLWRSLTGVINRITSNYTRNTYI